MAMPPENDIVPSRDIKPKMDDIEAILAMAGNAGAPMGEPGAEVVEEVVEEAPVGIPLDGPIDPDAPMPPGDDDIQVLADTLQIDIAKAQMLYDAAMQLPSTVNKTGAELATMLAEDFDLRMRLEQLALGAADAEPMPDPMLPPEVPV